MKSFNVINYDVNHKKFVEYDVIPYLIHVYEKCKEKPTSFEEFKDFVEKESMYQFWSRCQYEIILKDWPAQRVEEKWDVYDQIMMNIDIVTRTLMESI